MAPLVADTDEHLMDRVARGDQAAFRTLLERWEGAARRYAYRMLGDHHAAEDVAQETFVRIYRSADRYEPSAKFSTWFYTVIGNLCRDRLRAERRRRAGAGPSGVSGPGGAADVLDLEETIPGPEELLPSVPSEREEARALVRRAVAELPEKLQQALVLREFEGMAYQEIAAVMGANLGEVKTWIHRGRKTLAERLRRIALREELG